MNTIIIYYLSLTVYYLINKNSLYKQLITSSNILGVFALLGIILFTSIVEAAVYKQLIVVFKVSTCIIYFKSSPLTN